MARFEPTIPRFQSECVNQITLHSDYIIIYYYAQQTSLYVIVLSTRQSTH